MDILRAAQAEVQHARRDGGVADLVDQDEATELQAKHKFELVVKDLMGLAKHLGVAN